MMKHNYCSKCGAPMKRTTKSETEYNVETGEQNIATIPILVCSYSSAHDRFEPPKYEVTTFKEMAAGERSYVYGGLPASDATD